MTIDQAIEHCEQVAKNCLGKQCYTPSYEAKRCAAEHKQLAEWLQELKEQKKSYRTLTSCAAIVVEENAKLKERITYLERTLEEYKQELKYVEAKYNEGNKYE